MLSSIRLEQATFVALSFTGSYFTWVLAQNNGTFDLMRKLRDHGPHVLPTTNEPLRKFYTGMELVDTQLQVLAVFFWGTVNGDSHADSMSILNFAGQFAAAWGLTMIEGMRPGNRGKLFSYVMVWGILEQNFSFAVIKPLFFICQLASSRTLRATEAVILPSAAEVASVPISLVIGYIVPAYLMSLPAPSAVSHDQKQIYMAMWQVFPIWTSLLQNITKRVLGATLPALSRPSRKTSISTLRLVYASILVVATIPHVSSGTLAASFNLLPRLFKQDFNLFMGFWRTLVSATFSPAQKVSSITEGALVLLRWDEIWGSTTMIVWSSLMFIRSWTRGRPFLRCLGLLLAVTAISLLVGPCGCALLLIWGRDELVFSAARYEERKTI